MDMTGATGLYRCTFGEDHYKKCTGAKWSWCIDKDNCSYRKPVFVEDTALGGPATMRPEERMAAEARRNQR